ncbi:helix-turn-helix transcriptional regulator [uncultured Vibrio sp.]|uniref:helix-turn-helix domain-containing protein n=1 Tax=uncultured Vibrio sp. TaxID=114054 RepID=UPI00260724C1|nr:helix-turn-helix transcriptional regulator [uncultured Vibrio sp.]CAK2190829.1 putative XRE family transcriptional regulator [Vibrio crassostreae]CAK2359652.1 putative XRE family transcriptional regulator [Vibrio crassostreae]CAK2434632.1 putative XRE family transcriptional regulator [Vibrio crassostreae]CAK3035355.1 putative XRE family transcriptional regulator [Vibrio crassostreae]
MPKLNNNIYSINQYFTQLRIARGVTQKGISKQTGIPYRTVQRLEQHKAVINAEQIEVLCEFYQVSLVEMAKGTLVQRPTNSIEFLTHFERLPEPVKKSIIELVLTLCSRIQ